MISEGGGWGLAFPLWLRSRFWGFKSRWIMPFACNVFMAAAVKRDWKNTLSVSVFTKVTSPTTKTTMVSCQRKIRSKLSSTDNNILSFLFSPSFCSIFILPSTHTKTKKRMKRYIEYRTISFKTYKVRECWFEKKKINTKVSVLYPHTTSPHLNTELWRS